MSIRTFSFRFRVLGCYNTAPSYICKSVCNKKGVLANLLNFFIGEIICITLIQDYTNEFARNKFIK